MGWRTVAIALAGVALMPNAQPVCAQSADGTVLVTVRVVEGLAVETVVPPTLASAAPSAGQGVRVWVNAPGRWLLRLVPEGDDLLSLAPAVAAHAGGRAAAPSAGNSARLALLRLGLGVSGYGRTNLALPVPAPPSRPTHATSVTVEVAAE